MTAVWRGKATVGNYVQALFVVRRRVDLTCVFSLHRNDPTEDSRHRRKTLLCPIPFLALFFFPFSKMIIQGRVFASL